MSAVLDLRCPALYTVPPQADKTDVVEIVVVGVRRRQKRRGGKFIRDGCRPLKVFTCLIGSCTRVTTRATMLKPFVTSNDLAKKKVSLLAAGLSIRVLMLQPATLGFDLQRLHVGLCTNM